MKVVTFVLASAFAGLALVLLCVLVHKPKTRSTAVEMGVIHWEVHHGDFGVAGHGEPMPMDLARQWCGYENEQRPEIRHWVDRY